MSAPDSGLEAHAEELQGPYRWTAFWGEWHAAASLCSFAGPPFAVYSYLPLTVPLNFCLPNVASRQQAELGSQRQPVRGGRQSGTKKKA